MALFSRTFDAAAKARIAAYEADLQSNASDENWLDEPELVVVIDTGRADAKGRRIGFKIGSRTVDGKHYAWCQNARMVGGEWVDFGTFQRSKEFPSIEAGRAWATAAAHKRAERY